MENFTAKELFALIRRYKYGFVCPVGYEVNLIYLRFETKQLTLEPWGKQYHIGVSDAQKALSGGFDLISNEFDCKVTQQGQGRVELTIIPINNRGEGICMVLM